MHKIRKPVRWNFYYSLALKSKICVTASGSQIDMDLTTKK